MKWDELITEEDKDGCFLLIIGLFLLILAFNIIDWIYHLLVYGL